MNYLCTNNNKAKNNNNTPQFKRKRITLMNKILLLSSIITLSLAVAYAHASEEGDAGNNVLFGTGAGASLDGTGINNTFIGYSVGANTTTGDNNVFSGSQAGYNNTTGEGNVFSGYKAGYENTTGSGNIFSGIYAGFFNTTGSGNVFSGHAAGNSNTTGLQNVFLGFATGQANTKGYQNVFSGAWAGSSNTTGNNNVFSGYNAGFNNTTGTHNLFLGYYAGSDETSSSKLYIETDYGSRAAPLIYGDFATDLVGINGVLGVGTQLPTSTLHVTRADGSAQILVEETNATVAARTLFELKNNGNTKFTVNNTAAGVAWAFANSGTDFRLSRQGSGAVEFILSNDGNLTIQGNLTELSSREQKHNITAMSSQTVLNKVLALPIKEWSYKDSIDNIRHIGPMAEDFYQAFGLGESETGIATLDTSGVALAAIQGLNEKLTEQDEALAVKNSEISALQTAKEKQDSDILNLNQQLAKQNQQLTELTQMVQRLAAKDQWAFVN
jgi:hypothetical protein